MFFVLLSTIFWFLRALSEDYKADITYPVKYINLPENKVLAGKLPDHLKLTIEAEGFTILRHRILPRLRLNFNLAPLNLNKIDNDSSFILTRNAINELNKTLNKNKTTIKILDVSPDTIFFHFTDMISKKCKVDYLIPEKNLLYAKQYMQNGPIAALPDSITISGPESILDTIYQVYTEPVKAGNLTDTLEKEIALQEIEQVEYSQKKVKLTIPVDKFTESSYIVPIKTFNAPDSISVITFPNSVKISYRVTLSYFEKAPEDLFTPYIDFTEANAEVNKLKVKLSPLPEYIHSVNIYPTSVEYLIKR